MARLLIGSITVIVKGFFDNNGSPYFQRAIPKDLQDRFGKARIKVPLREKNGNFAVQCHRLYEQFSALFRAMRDDPTVATPEVQAAALALLNAAGLEPRAGVTDERIRLTDGRVETVNAADFLHDFLADNDFSPSAVTDAAFSALRGQFPVLLSEAFAVYLSNHRKSKNRKFVESQKQHWDKLVSLLGDKPITAVTRDDAKCYRDHRLASGVSASTVRREINVIRAICAKAILELSLGIPNQFSSLDITAQDEDVEGKDRISYSEEEIVSLVSEATRMNDEQRRIVIVLAFTGARLAEIVGLRKDDFDQARMCAQIRWSSSRSLKTKYSRREVPLLPPAYKALLEQANSTEGEFLFPAYSSDSGTKANVASATLNKWASRYVKGKSMHCFRHAYRDRMRAVMCPETIAKEIGGWSGQSDVSSQYGQGHPLEMKVRWLEQAYQGILSKLGY